LEQGSRGWVKFVTLRKLQHFGNAPGTLLEHCAVSFAAKDLITGSNKLIVTKYKYLSLLLAFIGLTGFAGGI